MLAPFMDGCSYFAHDACNTNDNQTSNTSGWKHETDREREIQGVYRVEVHQEKNSKKSRFLIRKRQKLEFL